MREPADYNMHCTTVMLRSSISNNTCSEYIDSHEDTSLTTSCRVPAVQTEQSPDYVMSVAGATKVHLCTAPARCPAEMSMEKLLGIPAAADTGKAEGLITCMEAVSAMPVPCCLVWCLRRQR